MIRNEKQYRIARGRIEEFEHALADYASKRAMNAEDKLWLKVQKEALSSQLEELRSDAEEYDSLRAGGPSLLEVSSLDEIPQALVKARIAAGLTQKELADRLGLKEQQIQRYEAADYAGASLERIREVMQALGIKLSRGIFLPATANTLGEVLVPGSFDALKHGLLKWLRGSVGCGAGQLLRGKVPCWHCRSRRKFIWKKW